MCRCSWIFVRLRLEFRPPAPSCELQEEKVCPFPAACSPPPLCPPVAVPVSVPSWDPRGHPPAQPQLLHSGVATVSDEEYSYLGPQLCYRTPSLLCPLPLASAPAALRCVVPCCTASFSAMVHRARLSQSARLSGGSRRTCCPPAGCRAPGGFQGGPQLGMLVGASPATQGSGPNTCSRALCSPETRALDLTSWGLRLNALSVIPVVAVSACPFSPCPQPVLPSPL